MPPYLSFLIFAESLKPPFPEFDSTLQRRFVSGLTETPLSSLFIVTFDSTCLLPFAIFEFAVNTMAF